MTKIYVKCANMACDFKGSIESIAPPYTKKVVMGKASRVTAPALLQFRCPKCSTRWRQKDPQAGSH